MHKTRLVVGFGVAGVVLLASSAAFACTAWKGKMVVTGGGGSTTVIGTASAMQYCSKPADNAAAPGGGAHGSSGSSITIAVSGATCGSTAHLAKNTYFVNFVGGKAYSYTLNATTHKRVYSSFKADCMKAGNGVVPLSPATLSVPDSGVASGTFKLPAGLSKNGPSDASAVCVSDNGAYQGNQAPLVIV